MASLKAVTEPHEEESAGYRSRKGTKGPRGRVNEATRQSGAAAAWGANPESDATCLNYSGNLDHRVCRRPT